MKNKILLLMAAALIGIGGGGALTGCSAQAEAQPSVQESTEQTKAQETQGFTLYYPSYMVQQEGETLTLDQKPEKIVVLSNSALQIMIRCDVKPIAVTSLTASVEYPQWVEQLPVIETGKSSLDTEAVIAMEPDLLIMGVHLKEDFGTILEDAGIPVYYTSEGPSITYAEVKEEAEVLTRSFGTQEQVQEVLGEFEAVEQRAAAIKDSMETKDMMILFSFPPSYQQTSKGYLGSILSMLPFDNMSDTLIDPDSRTAPLDLEKLVELNPQVIFAISPTMSTAELLQQSYQEEMAKNPGIWDKLEAVNQDNLICLSSEYVTSKGIQIISSMNQLMDRLEEKFGTAQTASGIQLEYPQLMQDKGYTTALKLAQKPEKVVAMSASPVLALHRLQVNMIAVPKSSVVDWPEDLANNAAELNVSMNSNFDIETVIAMDPDLVIMGYTSAETYGHVLEEAQIPVYYVDAGHTVSYESIKQQTEVLIDAFGKETEAGKEMKAMFTELEKRLDTVKKQFQGEKIMILQSSPPNHYIQTSGGTLGSMADMLGFTNVYENSMASMAEIDLEAAVSYEPDLVLAVGASKDGQEHQKLMEEDFAKNPSYWESIQAIEEGDIIYLPNSYISSAGINIVDNINNLITMIEEKYEAEKQ